MPNNLKIVEFIRATGAFVKKAEAVAAEAAASKTKLTKAAADITSLAEQAADALIASGHYKVAQRNEVVKGLSMHDRALKKLANLASKIDQSPAPIGRTVPITKTAEETLSPFAGQPTTKKKASDMAFEKYFTR